MKNFGLRELIFLLCAFVIPPCFPDEDASASEQSSYIKWLKDKGFQVRKSFSGTAKDQTSPAQLSYFNQDSNAEFFNLDIGVKVAEYSIGSGNWDFRIYPVLEKHKSNNEQSEIDKESVAANTELDFSFNDSVTLLTNFNYKLNRDKQNDKTTKSTIFFASIIWADDFAFGRNTLVGEYLQLYYLPSIGYEKYLNLPIEQKIDGLQTVIADEIDEEFHAARLQIELKPFWKTFESRLIVNLGYTKRWLLGESSIVDDSTDFTEFAITYYLNTENTVGIGFNYSNGKSPSRNFIDEENSSIGVNFKF